VDRSGEISDRPIIAESHVKLILLMCIPAAEDVSWQCNRVTGCGVMPAGRPRCNQTSYQDVKVCVNTPHQGEKGFKAAPAVREASSDARESLVTGVKLTFGEQNEAADDGKVRGEKVTTTALHSRRCRLQIKVPDFMPVQLRSTEAHQTSFLERACLKTIFLP
jgi:hypothetical protein